MKELLEKIPFYNSLVVPYHVLTAFRAGAQAGWPARKLKVIGVTGTNGKTTTAFMIWKMLNSSGRKAGLMTTVAWGVDKLEKQVEHMTTVDAVTLNKRIAKIAEAGAEYLVLEVTSHALAQHRILGVPIEVAVFTNLTHEHLDYHRTQARYRKVKMKLFDKAKYGVVNADDLSCDYFMDEVPEGVTYGIRHGEVRAKDVSLGAGGVEYTLQVINGRRKAETGLRVKTQIPGEFNVYNSLAAACVGRRLGLTDEEIVTGLAALDEVEGRMNRIDEGQDYEVIVDFAHTPDAFQKVFDSVTPHKGGRVISLFGGAGRRDESTRAERGEIGGKYSDIVIITEDDSRDEDPAAIAEEFVEGAEKAGCKEVLVELDRKKAIEKAVGMAKKGDLVLILGKGHEKTILRVDGAHPFEDLKVTRKAVRKLQKSNS
ncbi:UDP-N-acetylmuramoyl-L-alanyl-D-glutamate--2,6-diaminopimelate ligase [Candidatus Saccharibacteria bacterium]|nr:UDP-N-acetylmuramoyl-L-alanyl-D-glutamate--2,6-diaminopimelate ligase [Candidatus Saccharibacteria bacterium]